MSRILDVYNLEFEWPDRPMRIASYEFVPAKDYEARFSKLQHLVTVHKHTGTIKACTGGHVVTGQVMLPLKEKRAALGWGHENPTELNDILLLLSLFTGRKVFTLREGEEGPIVADPRQFHYGGSLGLSLGQVERRFDWGSDYSLDLSRGVSKVNKTIRSRDWRSRYGSGHFLFLFVAACHRQIIESSFLLSWTIWEHLFRLHNQHWLSRENLKRLAVEEKVAFILTEYQVTNVLKEKERKRLSQLAKIRHALVHDGIFPNRESAQAADVFVRVTEYVIAKTLGLSPSEVFSPRERLDRFLNNQQLI